MADRKDVPATKKEESEKATQLLRARATSSIPLLASIVSCHTAGGDAAFPVGERHLADHPDLAGQRLTTHRWAALEVLPVDL